MKSKLEIYGSKSTAFLNRFNHGVELYKEKDAALHYELSDIIHQPECNDCIQGDLKAELDHFVDALLNCREFVMKVEDAISAINVIESIMESYEKGVPVDVKSL